MIEPTQNDQEAQGQLDELYANIADLTREVSSARTRADLYDGAVTNRQSRHAGNFVDGMNAAASIQGLSEQRDRLNERKAALEERLIAAGRLKYRVDYTAYYRHSDGSSGDRSRGADLVAADVPGAIICLKRRVEDSWPSLPFVVSQKHVELSDDQVAQLKAAEIGYGHEQEAPLVRIEQVKVIN